MSVVNLARDDLERKSMFTYLAASLVRANSHTIAVPGTHLSEVPGRYDATSNFFKYAFRELSRECFEPLLMSSRRSVVSNF